MTSYVVVGVLTCWKLSEIILLDDLLWPQEVLGRERLWRHRNEKLSIFSYFFAIFRPEFRPQVILFHFPSFSTQFFHPVGGAGGRWWRRTFNFSTENRWWLYVGALWRPLWWYWSIIQWLIWKSGWPATFLYVVWPLNQAPCCARELFSLRNPEIAGMSIRLTLIAPPRGKMEWNGRPQWTRLMSSFILRPMPPSRIGPRENASQGISKIFWESRFFKFFKLPVLIPWRPQVSKMAA